MSVYLDFWLVVWIMGLMKIRLNCWTDEWTYGFLAGFVDCCIGGSMSTVEER